MASRDLLADTALRCLALEDGATVLARCCQLPPRRPPLESDHALQDSLESESDSWKVKP